MTDRTTDAVQSLYADYPYPAHGVVSGLIAGMLGEPMAAARAGNSGRPVRVIDAGCGTGEQTIGIARSYSGAEVVGIDLSEASLTFARQLGERHHARVRFERRDLMAPIENLGVFDVLVSVGTLHHLSEPKRGFQHLREIAANGAVFLGMVYGAYGRWETFRIRDALSALSGPVASREERLELLRSAELANNTGPLHYAALLRRRLRFGPDLSPLEAARRVLGGRSAAYQADAFTHAQEVAFTWADLARVLGETGFRLLGWPHRSGMPDSPEQLFRGAALEKLRGRPLLELAAVYERVVCPPNLYFLATAV